MPKSFTRSFEKGAGSLRHNNREFHADNVDPKMSQNNIYFKQEPLEEAYEKCFGEAVREYNSRQNRKDRKISSYLDKIRKSKNGEQDFYESVVQFGNHITAGFDPVTHEPTEGALIVRDLLIEYLHQFIEDNPNLYVFNAVLHMDEFNGTPHLHIDWIPLATEFKNGMQVRNSLDKALRQQGIEVNGPICGDNNATTAWEARERARLVKIIEQHGYEFDERDGGGKHLSVADYKKQQRLIDARIEEQSDIDLGKPHGVGQKYYKLSEEQANKLNQQFKVVSAGKELITEGELAIQKSKVSAQHQAEQRSEYLADREKKLDKRENRLQKRESEASKKGSYPKVGPDHHPATPRDVQSILSKNDNAQKQVSHLQEENQTLKADIQSLTNENTGLKRELTQLRSLWNRAVRYVRDLLGLNDAKFKKTILEHDKERENAYTVVSRYEVQAQKKGWLLTTEGAIDHDNFEAKVPWNQLNELATHIQRSFGIDVGTGAEIYRIKWDMVDHRAIKAWYIDHKIIPAERFKELEKIKEQTEKIIQPKAKTKDWDER